MANSGNRFTSVNLNKSYGHGSHANQSNSGGYGLGRGRGGGGGGGMVVLSRPRSSHKAAPKLSIPPPLNLPSLRKEHEKFDTLGTGSGAGGAGGSGARPSSSGMGWSKPSAIVVVERDEVVGGGGVRPLSSEGVQANEVVSRGGNTSAYMPPSARGGVGGADVSVAPPVEKISVLRGEDFPSLRATLNAANGQSQKQKDSALQKHRHGISEEPSGGSREGFQGSSQVDMRPQVQPSRHIVDNVTGGDSQNSRPQEQGRKKDDYFPGPLPLVRLSPRSDWADDERDTSHGLSNRSRDHGYSKTEAHWDRDFDFPRNSFLPHKPAQYQFDRRGQRDDDVGKGLSNEVSNADPFVRDSRAPSLEGRQGHAWRTSMAKDGFGSQDVGNYKNNLGARPIQVNREMNRENKYNPGQFGGATRDEYISGGFAARDLGTERSDQGYIHNGRQQWNNFVDGKNGRGADRNYQQRFVSDRYRVESSQNNMRARPSFSSGSKGLPATDHLPNFSRDKRSFSNNEKPFVEDPFLGSTTFDGQDPFSGGVLGVVKRKKDSNKLLDFPDPARESFEAELERVQQVQEQERRRVVEEQERAMEMARREEEERLRLIREQEDRQRRLEEEAREAVWRAEQEKLEVVRKAEELKIAREEEKQRIMMEEERRKQAAKQKLLELEEKIAKRQTEPSKADSGDITANTVKERDLSRPDDFASWEDGERMVERITNSASSDSSLSRPFDMGPRAVSDRDGSFAFTDRGKSFNSWRRDIFDNGNNSFFSMDHENAHMSPRREASIGGRSFHRKDMYGGQGYMPTSGPYRGGVLEPHMEDFPHARGYRWNVSGEGDHYGRNMEFEADFHENVADKYEMGWGQGQGQGRGYSPFPDRLYPTSDLDEFYSYGRSRYPARQPRVLPPPAFSSIPRTSFKTEDDGLGSSSYENGNAHFNHALQVDSTSGNHHNNHEENSDVIVHEQRANNEEQEQNNRTALGCDSQSSLSVSSPPSSPTQLSPDDFDESRDSLAVSGVAEGQDISLSENEADHLTREGKTVTVASSVGDDEEWTVENIEVSQYQEEYDEDVGYHVEDEVHGGEGEKPELAREFDDMHFEKKGSSDITENLVLGFDQGVEVVIPNDDHEKTLRVDDTSHVRTQGTVGPMKPSESFGDLSDRQSLQIADGLQHSATESSGAMAFETEPNNASAHNSMSIDPSAGKTSSSSVHFQQLLPPSQAVPSVSGVQGPAELPKLQFGLFSGPSLIPSPVPAIQIGSIQMPLQLHPHIGPPLPHMHASEAPLFQFGQLRYPSPMSQGILSLTPQPMSYGQPNAPQNFPSSQAPKGPLAVKDSSSLCSVKNGSLFTVNSDPVQPSNQLGVCQETKLKEVAPSGGNNGLSREDRVEASSSTEDVARPELRRRTDNCMRRPLLNNRASESRPQGRSSSFHSTFNARNSRGPTVHQFPGSKGRRSTYSSRSSDTRLASPANDSLPSDANGFQRRPQRVTQRYEFRVRQTADVKQFGSETQSDYVTKDSGTQPKNGLVKEIQSDQPKLANNSSLEKPTGKYATKDGPGTALHPEGSLKRNIISEDDIDAPLQSGIVRVYQQPGIEAPSDEDDFIEVRSKRQMLNDRREQREKEIKAKSSNTKKPQRKSRPAPQGTTATRSTNRAFALSNVQSATNTAVLSKRSVPNNEVSAALNNKASQPSALAGSQSNAKALTVKPLQSASHTTASQTFRADGSDLTSDGTSKVDGVQSTLGFRGGSCTKQSVMTLTQTQLEEAMKPGCFVTKTVPMGDQSSSVGAQNMPSISLSKDSSFSSAPSPISSLLAGEKIQFGDVIPPTILSPCKHVASQGTRLSSLSSLDIRTSQSIPSSKDNCDILFEKEKPLNESYRPLEKCAAEAKGAVSAVIRNNEVVGNGIRSSDIDGISAGMSGDQHTKGQSKAEENLSVSLPADLSVETPPISIWPPLPTPHSSSQMPSPFPGGPTSHFPFYDMNPMMGGPVFAFGPSDESVGPASQPQKSSAPSSGPLGTWQQCHTGIDSLYGPAGFTAPFISPPGSIPGVQGGPPHMVVYNHFASVGQFGQVGLSYMGTTYVPSGKQPDWKHNPTSTAIGGGEGVSVLRNASNVPTQASHLAPGSPLLSMASPLGMYEVSPFQSSNDTSIHPHWSHVQTPSVPSQSSHGSSDHHSSPSNGFSKPQTSSLADGRTFSVGPHAGTTPFADALGLVDPPASSGSEASALNLDGKGRVEDSSRINSASKRTSNKAQPAHQKNAPGQQHYSHYQRGAAQRNGSGAEWSNHKMGFRGRNQSSGGDRSFPGTKVKQIYVPKQNASGTSAAV
ncbi:hypothetical protein KSS87_009949 [Heliosperma pusillum]|nr:hypothetical protein KSS87_009949 [Heliosperma pusillum]